MITKEWIGGFICGEGCFTFNATTPVFQITLSIKDKPLLKEICKILNVGKICIAKKNVSCTYGCSGTKNCLKLIKEIDEVIFGDKLIDYNNWKEGIKIKTQLPKDERLSEKEREFINKIKPRQNKERKSYIWNGLHCSAFINCNKCGKQILKTTGYRYNKNYCKDCRIENEKGYQKKWQTKNFRYEERKEKGLCPYCGKKNNNGLIICNKCLIRQKKYY